MFEYALERKPDHAFALDLAADCYLKLGNRRKGRELSKQSNYLRVSGTHLGFQLGFYDRREQLQVDGSDEKPDLSHIVLFQLERRTRPYLLFVGPPGNQTSDSYVEVDYPVIPICQNPHRQKISTPSIS